MPELIKVTYMNCDDDFCLTDCGPSDGCNPDEDCNPDNQCNPD